MTEALIALIAIGALLWQQERQRKERADLLNRIQAPEIVFGENTETSPPAVGFDNDDEHWEALAERHEKEMNA